MNPVLLKRAIVQFVSDERSLATWMSTFFQPPDLDTRLEQGSTVLGIPIRELSVADRMVLVGGRGAWHVADELRRLGWKAKVFIYIIIGVPFLQLITTVCFIMWSLSTTCSGTFVFIVNV